MSFNMLFLSNDAASYYFGLDFLIWISALSLNFFKIFWICQLLTVVNVDDSWALFLMAIDQIFEPFGPVELVQLPLDLETGHCKGFGFVQVS